VSRLIVTIDGPAGTGKSSASARLAERIGCEMLDTGAMYRAAALLAIDRRIDPSSGPAMCAALAECPVTIDWHVRPAIVRLGGLDVSHRIREPDVTEAVSAVAANAAVREHMVRLQRAAGAAHHRLVSEGRDQGTVVFPDADVRIWLDARSSVRAGRRCAELRARGIAADEDTVRTQIEQRDHRDRTRVDGPLVMPEGAVVVDTSELTFDEVVDALERAVRARVHVETRSGAFARGAGTARP
jgi:cytidylate kinase